ncbi:MAG: helix-turn-helix transcriptional regulator [Ruminococcus sp.]|nr:helix-turn-helix transcriptional regulator [Ruminococcus sp.]
MFYEQFNHICISQGTTPSAIVKKLGLSTSKITAWKRGSIPKPTILEKLSNELSVPVSAFFSDKKEKPTPEGELGEDLLVLHRNGKRIEYHLTEEQLAAVQPLLDQLNAKKDPDF